MKAATILSLAAVAASLAALAYRPAPAEPTFALVGVAEDNEYVLDYGMTADDCRRASFAYDMRFSALICEPEA